jgi:ribosomal protein S27E
MYQPDLYNRMCGEHHGHQAELFPASGAESNLRCEVCGSYLVETPGGYYCCPKGHGRLLDTRPECEE